MCLNTYKEGRQNKNVEGFYYYDTYENPKTSFYADIYFNSTSVVIAFKGSQEPKDWIQDYNMHFRKIIPSQFYDTRKLYDVLASLSDLQGKEFIFTGHSLGGSDAVYLGSKTGERTVTFNVYGIKNFLGKDIYTENITNYGNPKDPIFMKELKNQVGKIKYVFTSMNFKSNVKSSYSFHYLENMGDVNMAVDDITGKKFLENVESMTKSNINDDIYNLTDKTYQYLYGNKNFCSGYVTVDDYTRNGIKVEGYTRRCPYHNQTY